MRLGDLDAVVDLINSYKTGSIAKTELLWSLSQHPTIDAAPVVRCGECIHYEPCEAGKDFCCFHAIGIVKDDFCSYGERKDGGG